MSTKYKTCFKCGEVKPLSDFYKHKKMADGHLGKCKECTKRDVAEYRIYNPDKELEMRLKACANAPTSRNAYRAVTAAIKAGVLVRPDRCSACGCHASEHVIEAHHFDYTRPLDVIWVCVPCHRNIDAYKRKKLARS